MISSFSCLTRFCLPELNICIYTENENILLSWPCNVSKGETPTLRGVLLVFLFQLCSYLSLVFNFPTPNLRKIKYNMIKFLVKYKKIELLKKMPTTRKKTLNIFDQHFCYKTMFSCAHEQLMLSTRQGRRVQTTGQKCNNICKKCQNCVGFYDHIWNHNEKSDSSTNMHGIS